MFDFSSHEDSAAERVAKQIIKLVKDTTRCILEESEHVVDKSSSPAGGSVFARLWKVKKE